jgi:hypothetical protein
MLKVLAASTAPHPPFLQRQKGDKVDCFNVYAASRINFTAKVLSKPPDRSAKAFILFMGAQKMGS